MIGCELDICSVYIPGCSLAKHWSNVCTAKLFGVDVTKGTHAPKRMTPERAAFLRKMAQKAVQQ